MKRTPRTNTILVVKVCMEYDDVTSAGKLFRVLVAATGLNILKTVAERLGFSGPPVGNGMWRIEWSRD